MTEVIAPADTPSEAGQKRSGGRAKWIIGAAILCFWAYSGFVSPDTIIRYISGDTRECVNFAEKNKNKLFLGKTKIKAMDYWLKNGKMVVEVAAFNDGEDTYTPRICVIGGGSVQIVSIFENNAWR